MPLSVCIRQNSDWLLNSNGWHMSASGPYFWTHGTPMGEAHTCRVQQTNSALRISSRYSSPGLFKQICDHIL